MHNRYIKPFDCGAVIWEYIPIPDAVSGLRKGNDMHDTNDADIKTLTADQLDAIIMETEYAENGVAIGDAAAADQDLRRAAQRELARRMGHC